jgi:hypothetical protein
MDPKPDKEFEKHGEIVLLYEIIANSIYWQDACTSSLIIKRLLAVFSQTEIYG